MTTEALAKVIRDEALAKVTRNVIPEGVIGNPAFKTFGYVDAR